MIQKKRTCVVLGANGYIGRHLCYFLVKEGWEVQAYGNSQFRHPSLLPDVQYAQFDICDSKSVEGINLEVDYIFVFSGLTGTKNSFDRYKDFTLVNEIGLLNLLNQIRTLREKPRVIFPSSRLVYKGSILPLKEEDEKEAKTMYAANKLNCEQFIRTYHSQFKIHFTIFRICVPYGNLLDDSFSFGTIGFFLNQAKSKSAITLFGDGELRRTFTPIDSLCKQIIETCQKKESEDEIFNIGGESMSLLEAATPIAQKNNVPIEFTAWPEDDLKLESGDTVFDSSKIETIIEVDCNGKYLQWIDTL